MSTNKDSVTSFNSALGREVKAERARRSMSQADLVDEAAGMSLSTVGRIERGLGANTPQLLALAARFGMSLSRFIGAVEAEAAREAEQSPGTRFPIKAEAADLELQLRSANEDAAQGHGEVTGSPCGGKELGND